MVYDRSSPPATRFKGKYVDFCETQSSASLCELKMQKMRVDCCFLLSKTRWGDLHGKDAGVMYLDLTFHQPAKCKLSHATVTMDFHEIPDTKVPNPELSQERSDLEVTEFFGPQTLTAEKRERLVSTTLEVNPTVGVAGATFQGMKFARSCVMSYASRWQFEGSRFAPDYSVGKNSRGSRYRRVVWHLQENELEKQALQQNTVHSAVAFTHQSKPFYLDVKIEARLQRWHDRLKQTLVSPPRNRTICARATIQTSVRNNVDANFAKLARDLDKSMTEANLHPMTDNANNRDATYEAEESCQPNATPYLPAEFLALVGRHNGQTPPNLPLATKAGINTSMSTGQSESVGSESSNSSSTLVGEEDGKPIRREVAQPVVVETEPSNSSPELPAEIKSTEEESMVNIQESLSLLWQTSQFLAVWMAALIAALIGGLQIMQAILAQENQKIKKSAFKSGEEAEISDNHDS